MPYKSRQGGRVDLGSVTADTFSGEVNLSSSTHCVLFISQASATSFDIEVWFSPTLFGEKISATCPENGFRHGPYADSPSSGFGATADVLEISSNPWTAGTAVLVRLDEIDFDSTPTLTTTTDLWIKPSTSGSSQYVALYTSEDDANADENRVDLVSTHAGYDGVRLIEQTDQLRINSNPWTTGVSIPVRLSNVSFTSTPSIDANTDVWIKPTSSTGDQSVYLYSSESDADSGTNPIELTETTSTWSGTFLTGLKTVAWYRFYQSVAGSSAVGVGDTKVLNFRGTEQVHPVPPAYVYSGDPGYELAFSCVPQRVKFKPETTCSLIIEGDRRIT